MPKYYKDIPTKTGKGKFNNRGQKAGKHAAISSKPAKEVEHDKHATAQIKKLTNEMFKQKAKRGVPKIVGNANIVYG